MRVVDLRYAVECLRIEQDVCLVYMQKSQDYFYAVTFECHVAYVYIFLYLLEKKNMCANKIHLTRSVYNDASLSQTTRLTHDCIFSIAHKILKHCIRTKFC